MNIITNLTRQYAFSNRLLLNKSIRQLSSLSIADINNIEKLVKKKDEVVVFMKGNPEEPRCGFSNAVVQIMRMHGVKYNSYDVLQDEKLRQGIKEYSNWPTIPQIYINGEFVGGCDIMVQMHQNGELIEELQKIGIRSALLDKESETKDDKNSKTK